MQQEIELFDYSKLEKVADIEFDFGMNLQEYRNIEKEVIQKLEERVYKLYEKFNW